LNEAIDHDAAQNAVAKTTQWISKNRRVNKAITWQSAPELWRNKWGKIGIL
jgi:hypothetical protein